MLPHYFYALYRFMCNLWEYHDETIHMNQGIAREYDILQACATQNHDIIYGLIYGKMYLIYNPDKFEDIYKFKNTEINLIFNTFLELKKEYLKYKSNVYVIDYYSYVLVIAF